MLLQCRGFCFPAPMRYTARFAFTLRSAFFCSFSFSRLVSSPLRRAISPFTHALSCSSILYDVKSCSNLVISLFISQSVGYLYFLMICLLSPAPRSAACPTRCRKYTHRAYLSTHPPCRYPSYGPPLRTPRSRRCTALCLSGNHCLPPCPMQEACRLQ